MPKQTPPSPGPSSSKALSMADLTPIFSSLADSIATAVSSSQVHSFNSNLHLGLQECSRRKLFFSGEKNENVSLFLKNVNKVFDFYNLEEKDRLLIFPELLKGKAALWFNSNKPLISSWNELEKKILESYTSYESETQKMVNLLQRSQAHSESIEHYVACVQHLNAKLKNPYNEQELLKIASENLHPDYLDIVMNKTLTSFEDLKKEARLLEIKRQRKKSYQPPPARLMFDEEFGDFSAKKESYSKEHHMSPKINVTPIEINPSILPSISELEQHTAAASTQTESSLSNSFTGANQIDKTCQYSAEPRQVYCYRCNKPNVYAPDCGCNQGKRNKNKNRNSLN